MKYADYIVEHGTLCEVCQENCDTIYAFGTNHKKEHLTTRICPDCLERMKNVLSEYFNESV